MTTTKEYIDSFLDDNEKAALEYFADSDTMQQAVKKVLLSVVYSSGTLVPGKEPNAKRNGALSTAAAAKQLGLTNEVLGADIRAFYEAISLIENGYDNFALYKKQPEKVVDTTNPAI